MVAAPPPTGSWPAGGPCPAVVGATWLVGRLVVVVPAVVGATWLVVPLAVVGATWLVVVPAWWVVVPTWLGPGWGSPPPPPPLGWLVVPDT